MSQPSSQIDVPAFHHIVLWPLLIHDSNPAEKQPAAPEFQRVVEAFSKGGWQERTGVQVDDDYEYAEIVYFHPFVRDFLFGDGQTPPDKRTVRRFIRNDVTGVRVKFPYDRASTSQTFDRSLRVERAELFLIRPRIALLMIEISNRRPDSLSLSSMEPGERLPLKLDEVLYLQSYFRRVYPPYFDVQGGHGDCVTTLEWQGLPTAVQYSTGGRPQEFAEFTRIGAEPPVYAHWRVWLGPHVHPYRGAADRGSSRVTVQQLLDDRMPSLSYIGLADPSVVDEDDLDRLPAFDAPNLSYDPEFRTTIRQRHRYDRFRHWGTRYFGNGTSFVMLTGDNSFTRAVLLNHLRRHYTHLAVLAQYQHAALLYFADELADIARDLAGKDEERREIAWRKRIRVIQHRFLKFRTRSYFTEVSNQIQGRELFRFWFDQLGTAALFEQIASNNADVYQALEDHEAKELSLAQTNLARLAQVGFALTIGLAMASLVISFAALYPETVRLAPLGGMEPVGGPWIWAGFAVVFGVLAGWLTWLKIRNHAGMRT